MTTEHHSVIKDCIRLLEQDGFHHRVAAHRAARDAKLTNAQSQLDADVAAMRALLLADLKAKHLDTDVAAQKDAMRAGYILQNCQQHADEAIAHILRAKGLA